MPKRAACRNILMVATALLLLAGVGTWLIQQKSDQYSRPSETVGSHDAFVRKLQQVKAALDHGMTAEQMTQFASEIQTETTLHPLPKGDEFQFGCDLLIRQLRTLAALQNYRSLKLAQTGLDPLDPSGPRPNKDAIASEKICRGGVSKRIADLEVALSRPMKPEVP